jgi:hypothetical protein
VTSRNNPYSGHRKRAAAAAAAIVAAPLALTLASSHDFAYASSESYENQAGTFREIDLLSYPQFQSLSNPKFMAIVDRPDIAEVTGLQDGQLEIYAVRAGHAILRVEAIGENAPPLIIPLEIGVHSGGVVPAVTLESNVAYHGITPYASVAAAQNGLFYLIPADSELDAGTTKEDLEQLVMQHAGLKMAIIHSEFPHMIDTSTLATDRYKVVYLNGSGQVSNVSSEVLLFNAADMREKLKPEGGVITIEEIAKYMLTHRDEVQALDLNKDGVINSTDVGILLKMLDGVYVGLEPNAEPELTHAYGGIQIYEGNEASVSLAGRFTDVDSDELKYSVRTGESEIASASVSGDLLSIQAHALGSTTVEVTARDGRGGVAAMSFTLSVIANTAPEAAGVTITGSTTLDGKLVGSYDFEDADDDAEEGTTYHWYAGPNADGSGKATIANATTDELVITHELQGKYIFFEVTPRASVGTIEGAPVLSSPILVPANAVPVAMNAAIMGTPSVGESLTGVYSYHDADGDAEGATQLRWFSSPNADGTGKTAIADATTNKLVISHDLQGKYIFFEVAPRASTGAEGGATVLSGPVIANTAPVAAGVNITGLTTLNGMLVGSYDFEDPDDDAEGETTYRWYAGPNADGSGKATIANATTDELVITHELQGKYIFFEVTPRASVGTIGGAPVVSSPILVPANAVPVAMNAAIMGTPSVGESLTGVYSYDDADGDAEGATQLRWFSSPNADGTGKTAIADATANQLVISHDLQGKYIFFEVTPRASTGAEGGATVLSSPVIANTAPAAINLSMAGASGLGETLIAMYEYSDAEGDQEGATTFAWYVGAQPDGTDRTIIQNENTRFLTVTHEMQGKYVFFEITPRSLTGTTDGIPMLSDPTELAANAAPLASEVTIAGQPGYGNSLYGNYLFEDTDGESEGMSSFQWYAGTQADGSGRTPIAGATTRELSITSNEQGKYVFFEVTPRSLTGAAEGTPVTSAPLAIPANEAPYAHNVFLTGTPKTGETLAVHFTYDDAENDSPEATPTIQWYMAADSDLMTSEAISGETGASILVTADMEDKWVYAVVTPRASTGTIEGEPERSNALMIPVNQAPSAYNVTIAGTPYAGEQLTTAYIYSDSEYDSEGLPSYQWFVADDVSGTNKAPIAGATSNSYAITSQEAGRFVAVAITPTALSGAPVGEATESAWMEIAPELPVVDSFTFGDSDTEAGYLAGDFNWSVTGDPTGLQGFRMYWVDSEGSQLGHVISPPGSTDRTAAISRTDIPHGAVEVMIRPYRYVGSPSILIEGTGISLSLASIDNDDATEALAIVDAALVANDMNNLTMAHLANVGVTGVTEDNVFPLLSRLTAVRANWGIPLTASDMQAQLSALISSRDNLLQTIRSYYWLADEGTYGYAGVLGVNASNVGAVSKMLYKFTQDHPSPYIPTWAELQDVVSAAVPDEANTVITAAQGLDGSRRVTLTIDLRNNVGTGIEGFAQGSFAVTIPEIMPSPIALTDTTYFDAAYTGTGGIYIYVFKGPTDGTTYSLTNLTVNGAVIEALLPITTPVMDPVAPDNSRGSVQPQNGQGAGEINLSLISSKPGKIYYMLQDAMLAAPSVVQVVSGKDASEATPYASGSIEYQASSVGSYNTVFLTNMTAGVTMKLYVVLSNLSGVSSGVYTSPYPVTITSLSSLGVLNKFAAENNSYYGKLGDMQAIAPFVTEVTNAAAREAFRAARTAKGADLTEAEAIQAISESLINDAAQSGDWSNISLSVFSAAGMTNVTVDNLEAVKIQIVNERLSLGVDLSGIKLNVINSLFGQ